MFVPTPYLQCVQVFQVLESIGWNFTDLVEPQVPETKHKYQLICYMLGIVFIAVFRQTSHKMDDFPANKDGEFIDQLDNLSSSQEMTLPRGL